MKKDIGEFPEPFKVRTGFFPDKKEPSWTPTVTGIEARVCLDIATRQAVGLKKYGMTLEGNPASRVERIRHAYQEALDLAQYLKWELEKAMAEEEKIEADKERKMDHA